MKDTFTLTQAQTFIEENEKNINKKYHPEFHFAPQVGWINDPNGVSYFNGEYHLFYQYFPYDSKWGPMHWGHAKSKDAVKWEHLPVALAPDQEYDSGGCFSGSAIEKDGKLYLMYTGHLPNETDENLTRQNQNIAISEDGITFKKYEKNPVMTNKDVPEGSSIVDFRDPKVFERNGKYYCVIGSKTIDDKGQVLLYESEDLLEWSFVSVFLSNSKYLGTMVECPDYLEFEDKQYFILSAMNYTDEKTGQFYPHISWVIEGETDWQANKFHIEKVYEMDGGLDFYAPQSVKRDDHYVAVGWMQGWGRNLPTDDLKHQWAGQMTLPRILKRQDGCLKQMVADSVHDYIKDDTKLESIVIEGTKKFSEEVQYVQFTLNEDEVKDFAIQFANNKNERISLYYDAYKASLFFSRADAQMKIERDNGFVLNHSVVPVTTKNGALSFEIFIDKSSLEVFINGSNTLTNTFYLEDKISEVTFETINTLNIKELTIGKIDTMNN